MVHQNLLVMYDWLTQTNTASKCQIGHFKCASTFLHEQISYTKQFQFESKSISIEKNTENRVLVDRIFNQILTIRRISLMFFLCLKFVVARAKL